MQLICFYIFQLKAYPQPVKDITNVMSQPVKDITKLGERKVMVIGHIDEAVGFGSNNMVCDG